MNWFGSADTGTTRRGSQSRISHGAISTGRFTLQRLQILYQSLSQHSSIVNPAHENRTVENIREIAEIVVYGEQNTQVLFDYFAEKSILSLFLTILRTRGCSNAIKLQIVQTLSILVQSVKTDTSLYYMLSNNYINEVILYEFDFTDEEVTANYISLLKTLALKLNKETVQFFFNEGSFPLYERATAFYNHPDGMVRTSSWTVTLSIYRVHDTAMRKYLFSEPQARYFEKIVQYLHHRCRVVHVTVLRASVFAWSTYEKGSSALTPQDVGIQIEMMGKPAHWWTRLESALRELQDDMLFLNDLFSLDDSDLQVVLCDACTAYLCLPLILASLIPPGTSFVEMGDLSTKEQQQAGMLPGLLELSETNKVGPLLGLVLVSKLLFSIRDDMFVTRLVESLFGVPASSAASERNVLRENFFALLNNSQSEQTNLAAICVLYATITNPTIKANVLLEAGIAPAALRLKLEPIITSEINEQIQNQCYPIELVTSILELLERSPALHPLSTRVIAKLVIELVFHSFSERAASVPFLIPEHQARLGRCYSRSVEQVQDQLDTLSPTLFLQVFQSEWQSLKRGPLNVEHLVSAPELLVPFPNSSVSDSLEQTLGGTAYNPYDGLAPNDMCQAFDDEMNASQIIRRFMILRLLYTTLLGKSDNKLSLNGTGHTDIKEGKSIDLRSCEYIPVQLLYGETTKKKLKSAYLVIVAGAAVVVEPNHGALGRGITRSVAPLHCTEALLDRADMRMLHLCVRSPSKVGGSFTAAPPNILPGLKPRRSDPKKWYVSLLFSSPHNCVWARDELSKARSVVRQRKIDSIAQMLSDSYYVPVHGDESSLVETTRGENAASNETEEHHAPQVERDVDTGHSAKGSSDVEQIVSAVESIGVADNASEAISVDEQAAAHASEVTSDGEQVTDHALEIEHVTRQASKLETVNERVVSALDVDNVSEKADALEVECFREKAGDSVEVECISEKADQAPEVVSGEKAGDVVAKVSSEEEQVNDQAPEVAASEKAGDVAEVRSEVEQVNDQAPEVAASEKAGDVAEVRSEVEQVNDQAPEVAASEKAGDVAEVRSEEEQVGDQFSEAAASEKAGDVAEVRSEEEQVDDQASEVATCEKAGDVAEVRSEEEQVDDQASEVATSEKVDGVAEVRSEEQALDQSSEVVTSEKAGNVVAKVRIEEEQAADQASEVVTSEKTEGVAEVRSEEQAADQASEVADNIEVANQMAEVPDNEEQTLVHVNNLGEGSSHESTLTANRFPGELEMDEKPDVVARLPAAVHDGSENIQNQHIQS